MFTIDIDLINQDSTFTESYMVFGQPRMSSQTNASLSRTNASKITTFDILLLPPIDSGDGLSVQVKSDDGKKVGSAFTYYQP